MSAAPRISMARDLPEAAGPVIAASTRRGRRSSGAAHSSSKVDGVQGVYFDGRGAVVDSFSGEGTPQEALQQRLHRDESPRTAASLELASSSRTVSHSPI